MSDRFAEFSSSLVAPAAGAFSILPDDGVVLAETTRALYVGASGNLTVEMAWGQIATFANVQSGTLLPLRVKRVMTASTAASIVGLF